MELKFTYVSILCQILAENGTFIVATMLISNLTSQAIVSKRVSAHDAVRVLSSNLSDGRLPFPVELTPGVQVFPILHTISDQDCRYERPDMASICPSPSVTSTYVYTTPSSIPSGSLALTVTSIHSPSSCTSSPSFISQITRTVTKTVAMPCPPQPTSIHSPSTCTTSPLFISQITRTVTKTVAVPCPPQPTTLMPTMQPHVTECPPGGSSSSHLSTGGVVGLAFGTFAAGIFFTLLTMILCVACCNCCNQLSIRSAGWKPVPKTHHGNEMDYFQ